MTPHTLITAGAYIGTHPKVLLALAVAVVVGTLARLKGDGIDIVSGSDRR